MKKISIILSILLFSQIMNGQEANMSYNELWNQVLKLEKDQLTRSAYDLVQKIYQKADKESNDVQRTKALLFSSKYVLILEEEAQLSVLNRFKTEIEKTAFPTKNILESYLANLYWQYFQQNRYQFYNRTATETKVDTVDFRTWDLTTLFKEIDSHFQNALSDSKALQKTNLKEFKELMETEEGSEVYRPTLYDLLAHDALNFYKSDENSITRPADKFEIDSSDYLCDAYSFTQLKIPSKDATSLYSKAMGIYQELIGFHFSDPKLDALTLVDIERLNFIFSKAVFSDKDDVLEKVLIESAENIRHHETSALYSYELAKLYKNQGDRFTPDAPQHRWKLKKAIELCDQVIGQYPGTRGAQQCAYLKSQIQTPSLQLQTEKYIPVEKLAKLLVNYKNRRLLDLRAYPISAKQWEDLNNLYPESEKLEFIQKLQPLKEWSVNLINEGDYQLHSIEIPMPELPNGQYLIFALPKEGSGESFAYSEVQVTNLALLQSATDKEHIFQVVDRNNGAVKPGAKVTLYHWGNRMGQNSKSYISDKNGFVQIPLANKSLSVEFVKVAHGGDVAQFGNTYIRQKNKQNNGPDVVLKSFLFKDRSIYRPGQPLYFKGVLIEQRENKSALVTEENLTVELYDVNGQKASEMEVRTNDFGSFKGEFVIPSTGLTGQYYLSVTGPANLVREYSYFSVEEYKRPKFEVGFEPVTAVFKVNDSVTVKGSAKSFSGSNITDAKVSYRVERSVNYPIWYSWRRGPMYWGANQEIAHGDLQTDAEGNFSIDFKAIPDLKVVKEDLPVFSYLIHANVTDLNGETRTATTTVNVGYHAMTANILVDGPLNKATDENTITVITQNLNGQKVSAKGILKMHKLQAPEHVLRPRPWEAPDYQYWSKSDFKKLFPHEAYGQEHSVEFWPKGKLVFETDFDTNNNDTITISNLKKWDTGSYLIEVESVDTFGQQVTAKTNTQLMDTKEKSLPDNQLFRLETDKEQYNAGDLAEITFYSNAKDLYVTYWVEKEGNRIQTEVLKIKKDHESIRVPVTKDDLGGFAVGYSFTVFNSFHTGNLSISVPYPDTDLKIETLTFRDKMAPGTDETWSFKIKGPKGEKVTAELLASMYDASLDQFVSHNWYFNPLLRPNYYSRSYVNAYLSFGTENFRNYFEDNNSLGQAPNLQFDQLEWFGLNFENNIAQVLRGRVAGLSIKSKSEAPMAMSDAMAANASFEGEVLEESVAFAQNNPETSKPREENDGEPDFGDVIIRKNLKETAFFFPQLTTDAEGNVSFNFNSPEALTRWNLQLLAYTKDLKSVVKTLSTVTQKELMLLPNPPRFLREGDTITLSTKIANLSENSLEGFAQLELTDVLTGKSIDSELENNEKQKPFSVGAQGNTQISWRLLIPKGIQGVEYKIIAKSGTFSDGEQGALPVLTNRMLVTETLPMWVRSNENKTFVLDKLKNVSSTTLENHQLTLEITSNPAWYAVQALPYLMEYPYECNEQTFSRYYANTLASHIANSNPRIKEVFDQWANSDALLSNLEKNQELKSLLIQETPWLRDAQSETEQKKRIGLLFNLNNMRNEQEMTLRKLEENQLASGGWPWFQGGRENRFITQHIAIGFGHLDKLTSSNSNTSSSANSNSSGSASASAMLESAISYLDAEFVSEYEQMKKYASDLSKDHLSPNQLHFLYMRSFFKDLKTSKKVQDIMEYYLGQARTYWTNKNLYSKGLIALTLYRSGDETTAKKILRALEENSVQSKELGMYWKENIPSWYWHQAPIETHSLLIEAFSEIGKDTQVIDELKVWLLKNKQTNQWETTKATSDAVYALLLQGSDWLSVTDAVDVKIGTETIDLKNQKKVQVEAGTGYYKTSWNKQEITPAMATVNIQKQGEGIAWGALYWQYFEDLDKITSAETPLQLKKKLFLKKNTDTGEALSEIREGTQVKIGDLVRVRIELRADRDMEFVHMKDMRAAGFEPINVLSRYKWQDGLGYYESTRDASTNFFFDYLPKGVYVFEYDLRVNNTGNFSNGITTIQSMYAPEFSSHSEGIRVQVD
ncbi:alpha-2-macroglobulin family protein [Maribacter sp. 4G9]|uniref:alpha-2-macroglobulin family protein n=1 Tax=Maribacter sp. 4G9 TaxID=1889777 RepID=UPI000C161C63|nr:MG2 domain-containing protein [Maribacter sp. 4G9]PIB28223.1 alpha-2-macroglobulin [Maribacter sp. 4G9]